MEQLGIKEAGIGLIYWCGLEPRNGTSVQLGRLLGKWVSKVTHIYWDKQAGGASTCGRAVRLEVADYWSPRRGGRLWRTFARAFPSAAISVFSFRRARLEDFFLAQSCKFGVVYVVIYNEDQARMAWDILDSLGQPPYVLHLMDFLETAALGQRATPHANRLIREAYSVFGISEELLRSIELVRGEKAILVPPCGPVTGQSQPCRNVSKGEILRIAIVGSIYKRTHTGGERMLDLLAEVVPALSQEIPLVLVCRGNAREDFPEALHPYLDLGGHVSERDVQQLLASCHIALLTMLYGEDSLFRYSVPSRLPEYLSAGLPTIAKAVPRTAVWTFLAPLHDKCAVLVNTASELREAIENYARKPGRLQEHSAFAAAYAAREFDQVRWQKVVQDELERCRTEGRRHTIEM